jgi:leishmanolysin
MFKRIALMCITFAVATTAHSSHHDCIHDEIRKVPGYGSTAEMLDVPYAHNTSARTERHFTALQSAWQPIRVKVFFDQGDCAGGTSTCGHCTAVGNVVPTFESASSTTTCTSNDVLTDAKKSYIMDKLMPAAVAFYTSALNVVRVSGNLVVSGTATCGSAPGTPVPSDHRSTGVADADFIAYVTAVPKADRTSLTVAWAAACRTDSAGRAVVAHVNFIPGSLTNAVDNNAVDLDNDKSTAVHEIAHALGFSSPFFGSRGYLSTDGTTLVPGGTSVVTSSDLGKSVTYVTSPRVVNEVRSYFGCTTLTGGEIEDQGGSGTAGSHWEKRIFYEDSMAGISSSVRSYHSRFTLAFFEDTGHYTANYAAADSRQKWGKGKGCSFASKKCNAQTWEEFCFDTNSQNTFCTFDRLARGYCNVGAYTSSLPAQFQYFSSSAASGGSIEHTDYCPVVLPYGNRICLDPANADSADVYGQTYSTVSRCFDSDLIQAGRTAGTTRRETRCFVPECQGSRLTILVKTSRVLCPADGTAGTADLSTISGSYTGTITCPAASVFGCGVTATTSGPTTNGGSTPSGGTPSGGGTPSPDSSSTPAATSAGPETSAPPTVTSSPLLETPAPTPLSLSCAERVSCARDRLSFMPYCRQVAKGVEECFGTDCDAQMESFFAAVGVASNCSDAAARNGFQTACMEGTAGVADLCYLATASAVNQCTALLFALALSVIVFW